MNDAAPPRFDASSPADLRRVTPVSLSWRFRRLLWAMVQGTLFRWSFHTWDRWRAMLLRAFGARVGNQCTIRRTARVYYPWLFSMGDLSCLGDESEVYNLAPVALGSRVTISQQAYLCAGTHDYSRPEMPLVTKRIDVGDDVWLCARSFIGPGVTVHEGAVVAAVGVAMQDVPAWTVVGGNPAVPLKQRVIEKR